MTNVMCSVCFYMVPQVKTINDKCQFCHKDTKMELQAIKYEWNDGHPFLWIVDEVGFYKTFPLPKEKCKVPNPKTWEVSPLFLPEEEDELS